MTTLTARSPAILPARRRDLLIRPYGADGTHVVKDPRAGTYYSLGPEESFLLIGLDGRTMTETLSAAFERRFGQRLSAADLDEFLRVARASGLLDNGAGGARDDAPEISAPVRPAPAPPTGNRARRTAAPAPAGQPAKRRQSILYWRKSVYDPDRLFARLEPWLRFVWTRAFLSISAAGIAAASAVAWANRHQIISGFSGWDWRIVFLVWLTLSLSTTLHEFAHGLTCKHYGGEVHEVGFLLMFFMPCFYCNVSDAWLFRERSKRLLVTFAGGYWDLCLWAAAVFAWRLTALDTLPNYLAWVVLSVCGARIFFNLNPLLKLDGYYLLSDTLGIVNLRQRATDALAARVRWLLWGAARPARESRGRFLVIFGAASWLYSLALLSLMFAALVWFAGKRWGPAAAVGGAGAAILVMRGFFQNFSSGEVFAMFRTRRARATLWLLGGMGLIVALLLIPKEDRASGLFEVRSASRADVRAPVAGFLRTVEVQEGEPVQTGGLVARIEVPHISEHLAQKRAELAEGQSKLALVEAGARTPSLETGREVQIRTAERSLVRATLSRLGAELAELEETERKQRVHSPIGGLIVTPRLPEQVGRFVREGDLICTVEPDPGREIEVALPEQEVARVRPGQAVELKVRALPFDTLGGVVVRVGAAAATAPSPPPSGPPGGQTTPGPGTVTVYCQLLDVPADLRPGMSGDARIMCGRRPAGVVFARRFLRYIRTEFW
jgi:multidrug resistance efflux pump